MKVVFVFCFFAEALSKSQIFTNAINSFFSSELLLCNAQSVLVVSVCVALQLGDKNNTLWKKKEKRLRGSYSCVSWGQLRLSEGLINARNRPVSLGPRHTHTHTQKMDESAIVHRGLLHTLPNNTLSPPTCRPVSPRRAICFSIPRVKPALTELPKQYFKCPPREDTLGFVRLAIHQKEEKRARRWRKKKITASMFLPHLILLLSVLSPGIIFLILALQLSPFSCLPRLPAAAPIPPPPTPSFRAPHF